MAQVDDSSVPMFVMVEDSPDARLFIELSSYTSDLTEAHHALDLAFQGRREPDSALADANPYLVGFAVTAYCRTILTSNVRRPMTAHVRIPEDLLDIHEQIRVFRNATIAHSQSELAVTYPVGRLKPRTHEVVDVWAVTLNNKLPLSVAQRFRTLLEVMTDRLDDLMEPIRARLAAELRRAEPAVLLARPGPTMLERTAAEFDARSKRHPYPRAHTVHWDEVAEGDE